MKTLLIILTLFPIFLYAQTINDIPIDSLDAKYLQIVGRTALDNVTKVKISIDFGQEAKLLQCKKKLFYDKEGKQVKFNSMVDALNFFDKYGYDFICSVINYQICCISVIFLLQPLHTHIV